MTPEAALDAEPTGAGICGETVRFADGLAEVMKYPEVILLEVGPGQTLSTLAGQQPSTARSAARHSHQPARAPGDSSPTRRFF